MFNDNLQKSDDALLLFFFSEIDSHVNLVVSILRSPSIWKMFVQTKEMGSDCVLCLLCAILLLVTTFS